MCESNVRYVIRISHDLIVPRYSCYHNCKHKLSENVKIKNKAIKLAVNNLFI